MQTSRIPPSVAARFGLVSVQESTRVSLPLKGVECHFSVSAGLVEVQITQVFRQENRQPLDCEYLFPLPADASVFHCEADINGRLILARVRERAEAVKLAAEKKAEGRRVALVESERDNLFTLTLNNLQPDDFILVTLKYIQPLRALAGLPSVEIPFCPGIRYIPGNPLLRSNRGKGTADDTNQVPDASRISPVRIDESHPDAAFVEIQGTLDGKFIDPDSLLSPSHNIISRTEGETIAVRLSDKGEVPDHDFVLRWRERLPEGLAVRAWIRDTPSEAYALLEIRALKASGQPLPMDFYFLVDRSGSMAGIKWEKAALAVQTSVRNLTPKDRAMITLFNSDFTDFAEQPFPPEQLLAEKNFHTLGQLPPDGGTELAPALRHVQEVAAQHSPGRQKSLILITDAQVGNDNAILNLMKSTRDFPLHCFGVDVALNDALLLALARQQRGTFHSINPGDDVAQAVADLAQTIRHPVLQDLRLLDGWETADACIPPLYSGQVYRLSARSKLKETLTLAGRNGDGLEAFLAVAAQTTTSQAPYLHWCKTRIQRHIADDQKAEAIALSVQSNLICPLTAFIAWDDAEKVAIARHALVQPAFDPLDPSIQCGFGASFCPAAPRPPRRSPGKTYCLSPAPPYELNAPAEPYHSDPMAVATGSTAYLGACHDASPIEPFSPKARRAAFTQVLKDLRSQLHHPEWQSLCEAILTWAFADRKAALHRSNLLAQLLSQLATQMKEIKALRQQVRTQVGELRRASPAATKVVDRFEKLLDKSAPDVLAEALAEVSAVCRLPDLAPIKRHLAQIAQIEHDIPKQLAAFLQSAEGTLPRQTLKS